MKKVLLLLILTILLVGCAPQEPTIASTPASEPVSAPEPVSEPAPVEIKEPEPVQPKIEAVREISIIAKRFEFEPSTIEVNQGETVRLTVKSIDVKHGFAISEYSIYETLPPNKEVKIEFVADKVGEFTYYCSVPCGYGHGRMRGKLIVR